MGLFRRVEWKPSLNCKRWWGRMIFPYMKPVWILQVEKEFVSSFWLFVVLTLQSSRHCLLEFIWKICFGINFANGLGRKGKICALDFFLFLRCFLMKWDIQPNNLIMIFYACQITIMFFLPCTLHLKLLLIAEMICLGKIYEKKYSADNGFCCDRVLSVVTLLRQLNSTYNFEISWNS